MENRVLDPWNNETNNISSENDHDTSVENTHVNCFEDCFVTHQFDQTKLSDSDEYLENLQLKLKAIKGGSSKKDLIQSLAAAKEDCVARLLTGGYSPDSAEELQLAANPLVRHIAPHLQALTASELVQLLKADVLQEVTDEEHKPSVNFEN